MLLVDGKLDEKLSSLIRKQKRLEDQREDGEPPTSKEQTIAANIDKIRRFRERRRLSADRNLKKIFHEHYARCKEHRQEYGEEQNLKCDKTIDDPNDKKRMGKSIWSYEELCRKLDELTEERINLKMQRKGRDPATQRELELRMEINNCRTMINQRKKAQLLSDKNQGAHDKQADSTKNEMLTKELEKLRTELDTKETLLRERELGIARAEVKVEEAWKLLKKEKKIVKMKEEMADLYLEKAKAGRRSGIK